MILSILLPLWTSRPKIKRIFTLSLLGLLCSSQAWAIKVLVRGTASLEGQVQTKGATQILHGKLRDDLGGPIANALIQLEVLQKDGKQAISTAPIYSCSPRTQLHPLDGKVTITTDGQGTFCLRTTKMPQQGILRLYFAGSTGIPGTFATLPFDTQLPATSLNWDPRPEQIDLDAPSVRIAVTTKDSPNPESPVYMELLDERGQLLATAVTDERGRAIFEMPTELLAGPGIGNLTAKPRQAGAASIQAQVTRTARVMLQGNAPTQEIVPHDGYRFQITATTRRGSVEQGVIEVRAGNEILGAGTVKNGLAEILVAFDTPTQRAIDLTFRYLPSSPELREAEPLKLQLQVRPPSPLRKAPLVLLGALLLSWLARGWKRPPRAERRKKDSAPSPTGVLPELTAKPEEGATSWQGLVLDAHEQRPLEGVTIRVLTRDFHGEREVERVLTDKQGRFHLTTTWTSTSILLGTAPWHTSVERPLPKPGRIVLGLVSRRRMLLERLITVSKKFAPEQTQDLTPEQMAKCFEDKESQGGARWARSLEAAAFGADPPGEKEEVQLSEMEADLSRRDPRDQVRR